ncbi:hypothetical protein [Roseovarius sp.]|uniref:hypothetical protein n=1 Tax=Roseovarius sp. TaxID=1486281 RepID=UPI003BA8E7A9
MPFKRFITSIMAAAMALTVLSSAPARADNDTAKIIAGAAALAIIGMAIADANDNDGYYVSRHGYDPYRAQRLRQHNRWVQQQRVRQHNRWVRQQRYQRQRYHRHDRYCDHDYGHSHRRNW